MHTSELQQLPERFFKGQDRLKGLLPPELVAPAYRAEIAGFPAMDSAAHGEFGRAFYAGFPDLFHTIDDVVVGDSRIAARFTLRGSNTGSFMGAPATGKHVEVSSIVMLTIVEGRVTHLRAIFDQLGLMKQLGMV